MDLVAPKPLSLGFARMFQTLSEQTEVEVFATLEEAEAWLARPFRPPIFYSSSCSSLS